MATDILVPCVATPSATMALTVLHKYVLLFPFHLAVLSQFWKNDRKSIYMFVFTKNLLSKTRVKYSPSTYHDFFTCQTEFPYSACPALSVLIHLVARGSRGSGLNTTRCAYPTSSQPRLRDIGTVCTARETQYGKLNHITCVNVN